MAEPPMPTATRLNAAAWAQEDAITDTVRHIGVAVDSRCSGLTVLAVAIPQSEKSRSGRGTVVR